MKAKSIFLGVAAICGATFEMDACTGISLTAKDGSIIMARTIEWAKSRMNNKMVIASSLLQHTKMSISEISEYIGYQNPHYFTSMFKSRMGVTPTQYRKKFK